MKAIVTGSGGLIGSACARLLADSDWEVVGVDNDMRQQFFGPQGSTRWVIENLSESLARYRHYDLDIRDRMAIRELLKTERPDFIIHAAGQPSHDKAASIPTRTSMSTRSARLTCSSPLGIIVGILPSVSRARTKSTATVLTSFP